MNLDPHLDQFFGAYLYEDWQERYPSVDAALQAFMSGEPPEAVEGLAAALTTLLNEADDEERLAAVVGRYGVDFYPPGADLTYGEWLRGIRAALEAHLGGQGG